MPTRPKEIREVFAPYTPQILLLTALGFLGGVLEGIGINILIPLFSFVLGESGTGGTDLISRSIQQGFGFIGIDFTLKYLLIFAGLISIIRIFVVFSSKYLQMKMVTDYEKSLRLRLYKKILESRWSYLMNKKIGYVETVLMTDIPSAANLLQSFGMIIILVSGMIVYLLVAVNISLQMTAITILFGSVLFFALKPLATKTRHVSQASADLHKETAHYVSQSMIGAKTIKALFASEQVLAQSDRYFSELKRLRIVGSLIKSVSTTFFQPIAFLFVLVLFAVSYKTPDFNLITFIAVVYLIQRIFTYVEQLQSSVHRLSEVYPHLKSVLEILNDAEAAREDIGRGREFQFADKLQFKETAFSYREEKNILNEVSLIISQGEMVGIIGPSGSGKTTVVDLLLRLLVPVRGNIFLDNINIQEISLASWRRNIGYVSQDIFLLNDTFEANIKFYDPTVTEEDMVRAAKEANIYDVIMQYPLGFKAMVGERGVYLSGGQRQRIAIARILARRPKILILDEATSALDNESELEIQKAIENLKGKITVLIIAHRLSTILGCDKVYALKDGQIAEEGDPEELLKKPGSYFYRTYHLKNNGTHKG